MLARNLLFTAAGLLFAGCAHVTPLKYPETARTNQVDVYHGVTVADPYRWLEDDHSPETAAWVAAENHVTSNYLAGIPELPRIRERLTKLWNYERYGVPFKQGGRYFLTKNDGLQNQAVLYTLPTLDAAPQLLLDPNKLSADGTVALSGISVSEDGNLLAYGVSSGGSDWQEWRVRDVRSGQDLSDRVQWVKFSGADWTKDGKGFFYARYEQPDEKTQLTKPNLNQKLYFHRIGAPQSEDKLIYERPDQPEWGFGATTTDDGRYLVLSVSRGTDPKNNVFYLDLSDPNAKVIELLTGFQADFALVDTEGTTFWFKTDLNAPRGRIIAIDIAKPERANWRELVPQTADSIEGVSMVGNQFFVHYLHDAASAVRVFDRNGKPVRELALPGLGTTGGFGGKRTDTETFYSFTSFAVPPRIYRLDVASGTSTMFREAKVVFNPDDFETKQVFYRSKDGTRIPMFITARKGLKLDGRNPVLLYGYGGFRISLTPAFSVANLAWMEMGGVYAVPNLRGGGEYGEDWHLAGTKERKQNVFDDFIAAAEWLIENKYTSRDRLAIEGRSNGGLLIGACLTQRPDLFGATIPGVGVLDMLRYHKFTIGWAWASDYGTSDNAGEFKSLFAYSPLQNIRRGTKYPPTLILTADHDDRVVPAHSFKFGATLQAAQAGSNPVLIRIDTKAGHGAGKPTAKLIEEAADRFAFLVRELKVKLPAGF